MQDGSFDWPDFLKLAQELGSRPEESCRRTAISRAYYFIFHVARARVEANGFVLTHGGDSHKQVWEKFTYSPDPACQKLASIALIMKRSRQLADYAAHFPRINEETPNILEMATNFAERLHRLPARLPANTSIRN